MVTLSALSVRTVHAYRIQIESKLHQNAKTDHIHVLLHIQILLLAKTISLTSNLQFSPSDIKPTKVEYIL